MTNPAEDEYLLRIQDGLEAAAAILAGFAPGKVKASYKAGNEIVTEADRQISAALREILVREDDGWLSEEDPDDHCRLSKKHVWMVDPIDGTREFVDDIPEWSVSIGLVVDGAAIAGGVLNPSTHERFLGSLGRGVSYDGRAVEASGIASLKGAQVLASRQEFLRGDWNAFAERPFSIRPTGSIAYKLALVAAGLADATWTLSPKHEWDVAAGVALVRAGGGRVFSPGKIQPRLNSSSAHLCGLMASAGGIADEVIQLLEDRPSAGGDPSPWWEL